MTKIVLSFLLYNEDCPVGCPAKKLEETGWLVFLRSQNIRLAPLSNRRVHTVNTSLGPDILQEQTRESAYKVVYHFYKTHSTLEDAYHNEET